MKSHGSYLTVVWHSINKKMKRQSMNYTVDFHLQPVQGQESYVVKMRALEERYNSLGSSTPLLRSEWSRDLRRNVSDGSSGVHALDNAPFRHL